MTTARSQDKFQSREQKSYHHDTDILYEMLTTLQHSTHVRIGKSKGPKNIYDPEAARHRLDEILAKSTNIVIEQAFTSSRITDIYSYSIMFKKGSVHERYAINFKIAKQRKK